MKDVDNNLNKKFRVEGHIVGLVDSKPENIIKIFESSTNKILDLNSKPKKGGKVIISVVILLGDGKSKKKDETINVYLTTNTEEEAKVF